MVKQYSTPRWLVLLAFSLVADVVSAQIVSPPVTPYTTNRIDTTRYTYDSQGRPILKPKNDSLTHRNNLEDSITISYKYFDSTLPHKLDSSISDFYLRYPTPPSYQDLGNFGSAAHSLFFNPIMTAGFDPGFHAFDIYTYDLKDTRFYQTTRPYSELAYMLGTASEQYIHVLHTQNRSPTWNLAFEYSLISSPGELRNTNTNHSNLRISSAYQGRRKRYTQYFVLISTKIRSRENGGIQSEGALDSLGKRGLSDPFGLDTRLDSGAVVDRNPFNTNVVTGEIYSKTTLFLRHSYDLGQKDSIVTDSSVFHLFYPRLRFQHTFKFTSSEYLFQDGAPSPTSYLQYFGVVTGTDTIRYRDRWTDLTNEFALISFPQKNNLNQFFKIGAGLQLLGGLFDQLRVATYGLSYTNTYVNAEYRNRTRNQKWDLEASGQLFTSGSYIGDYTGYVSLRGSLGKNVGWLQLGAQNVNRTPSFTYNIGSSFPSVPQGDFKKENTTRFFAEAGIPKLQLRLTGEYFLAQNYSYFDSFFTARQATSLFTWLHIGAEKKFRLNRYFNFYGELHLQQKTGGPVNLPQLYTRDRIAFEGNFYKNLFLSTGLEFRYYSPYKADSYSPFTGQFFQQDNYTVSNRPEINLFLNFRIKSFKAFVRLENLNTVDPPNGFSFTKFNLASRYYPTRDLWFRLGIWWSFVN